MSQKRLCLHVIPFPLPLKLRRVWIYGLGSVGNSDQERSNVISQAASRGNRNAYTVHRKLISIGKGIKLRQRNDSTRKSNSAAAVRQSFRYTSRLVVNQCFILSLQWLAIWELYLFIRLIITFQRLNQAPLCTHLSATQGTHLELWQVSLLETQTFSLPRKASKQEAGCLGTQTHALHPGGFRTHIWGLEPSSKEKQGKAPGTSSDLRA